MNRSLGIFISSYFFLNLKLYRVLYVHKIVVMMKFIAIEPTCNVCKFCTLHICMCTVLMKRIQSKVIVLTVALTQNKVVFLRWFEQFKKVNKKQLIKMFLFVKWE